MFFQALKKIGRKVKVLPKSPTGSGEAIVPLTLLEHRNEIKGAALREGEVMIVNIDVQSLFYYNYILDDA